MNYKLDTWAGDTFHVVADHAKKIASASDFKQDAVEFDFNDIACLVNKDTDLDALWKHYNDAHIMGWKTVGPVCSPIYDDEVRAELSKRTQAAAGRQRVAQAEYEKKCATEKQAADELIEGVVLLIDSDKAEEYKSYVEKNSHDGYSRAVIEYAETWAKLMQVEISKGRTSVAEIANECQMGLGYLGITGFQYGCVVQVLAHFWLHGEELRKWHNKQYGVSEEKKGVANPAIFTTR